MILLLTSQTRNVKKSEDFGQEAEYQYLTLQESRWVFKNIYKGQLRSITIAMCF